MQFTVRLINPSVDVFKREAPENPITLDLHGSYDIEISTTDNIDANDDIWIQEAFEVLSERLSTDELEVRVISLMENVIIINKRAEMTVGQLENLLGAMPANTVVKVAHPDGTYDVGHANTEALDGEEYFVITVLEANT
jgi:hypothetical protein